MTYSGLREMTTRPASEKGNLRDQVGDRADDQRQQRHGTAAIPVPPAAAAPAAR
jgi:hypothetical protein